MLADQPQQIEIGLGRLLGELFELFGLASALSTMPTFSSQEAFTSFSSLVRA